MFLRRALAGNDQQSIRTLGPQGAEHAHQEIDILFMGHAPHEQGQRTLGGNAVKCAEA